MGSIREMNQVFVICSICIVVKWQEGRTFDKSFEKWAKEFLIYSVGNRTSLKVFWAGKKQRMHVL